MKVIIDGEVAFSGERETGRPRGSHSGVARTTKQSAPGATARCKCAKCDMNANELHELQTAVRADRELRQQLREELDEGIEIRKAVAYMQELEELKREHEAAAVKSLVDLAIHSVVSRAREEELQQTFAAQADARVAAERAAHVAALDDHKKRSAAELARVREELSVEAEDAHTMWAQEKQEMQMILEAMADAETAAFDAARSGDAIALGDVDGCDESSSMRSAHRDEIGALKAAVASASAEVAELKEALAAADDQTSAIRDLSAQFDELESCCGDMLLKHAIETADLSCQLWQKDKTIAVQRVVIIWLQGMLRGVDLRASILPTGQSARPESILACVDADACELLDLHAQREGDALVEPALIACVGTPLSQAIVETPVRVGSLSGRSPVQCDLRYANSVFVPSGYQLSSLRDFSLRPWTWPPRGTSLQDPVSPVSPSRSDHAADCSTRRRLSRGSTTRRAAVKVPARAKSGAASGRPVVGRPPWRFK